MKFTEKEIESTAPIQVNGECTRPFNTDNELMGILCVKALALCKMITALICGHEASDAILLGFCLVHDVISPMCFHFFLSPWYPTSSCGRVSLTDPVHTEVMWKRHWTGWEKLDVRNGLCKSLLRLQRTSRYANFSIWWLSRNMNGSVFEKKKKPRAECGEIEDLILNLRIKNWTTPLYLYDGGKDDGADFLGSPERELDRKSNIGLNMGSSQKKEKR